MNCCCKCGVRVHHDGLYCDTCLDEIILGAPARQKKKKVRR
jgi:hypothetical protein